jgi:hypothetical protein
VEVRTVNVYQADDMMVEIMRSFHIEDFSINHLRDLRARNERLPIEITGEYRRLEFMRQLAEDGRIGNGDRHPSLLTIRGLERWMDFAGGAAQCPP